MLLKDDIGIHCNFYALMRERGKLVPGSRRVGHNVFTTSGRNFLSKLISWQTIAGTDIPFTNRRVRWVGLGIGSQLEASSVSALVTPALATPTNFLVPIDAVEFPTSTSVRFIKEFALADITILGTPVAITEAGLFADVSPAQPGGTEDVAHDPGVVDTILNPALGVNSPVAYKAFGALTKTIDFTLEIRWDLRIS